MGAVSPGQHERAHLVQERLAIAAKQIDNNLGIRSNRTWVDFGVTTGTFTDEDEATARHALVRDDLPMSPPPASIEAHPRAVIASASE